MGGSKNRRAAAAAKKRSGAQQQAGGERSDPVPCVVDESQCSSDLNGGDLRSSGGHVTAGIVNMEEALDDLVHHHPALSSSGVSEGPSLSGRGNAASIGSHDCRAAGSNAFSTSAPSATLPGGGARVAASRQRLLFREAGEEHHHHRHQHHQHQQALQDQSCQRNVQPQAAFSSQPLRTAVAPQQQQQQMLLLQAENAMRGGNAGGKAHNSNSLDELLHCNSNVVNRMAGGVPKHNRCEASSPAVAVDSSIPPHPSNSAITSQVPFYPGAAAPTAASRPAAAGGEGNTSPLLHGVCGAVGGSAAVATAGSYAHPIAVGSHLCPPLQQQQQTAVPCVPPPQPIPKPPRCFAVLPLCDDGRAANSTTAPATARPAAATSRVRHHC